MDPDGKNLKVFRQTNGCCAQGIATDSRGDVFLAGSMSSNHVGHYKNDGTFVRNITVSSGPTGLGIDAKGKLWANTFSQWSHRIDPVSGQVELTIPTKARSYTYSDVTGYVVRTATSPQGTWTVIQNCGNTCEG
jgi:streptogramin lyase